MSEHGGPVSGTMGWSYKVVGPIYAGPVIGAGGGIAFGSADATPQNVFFALAPSGALSWSYGAGDMVSMPPSFDAEGNFYGGSWDNNLYALDSTGAFRWSYDTGADGCIASPVFDEEGVMHIGSRSNIFYALTKAGALSWSYAATGLTGPNALGASGMIYGGSSDRNVYSMVSNGSLRWSYGTGSTISQISLDPEDNVYGVAGSPDRNVYCLGSEGMLRWSYRLGLRAASIPALGTGGRVHVGSTDGTFYTLTSSGGFSWSYRTGDGIWASCAVDSAGRIFTGSDDGRLYSLSPAGALEWSFATGAEVQSPPSIGSDGRVYVGTSEGRLYAFGEVEPTPTSTPPPTPTPTAAPGVTFPAYVPKLCVSNTGYAANPGMGISVFERVNYTAGTDISTGPRPQGMEARGQTIFVACAMSDALSVVSLDEWRTVASVPVGSGPLDVAVDPEGAYAYVTCAGTDPDTLPGSLWKVGLRTLSAEGSAAVGRQPNYGIALDPSGRYVGVSNMLDNTLSVFRCEGLVPLATVYGGELPMGMGLQDGSRYLYVADYGTGPTDGIAVIDTGSGRIVSRIDGVIGPVDVVIPSGSRYGYVSNFLASSVSVIDLRSRRAVGTIPVGRGPALLGVDAGHGYLYVPNFSSPDGSVSVVDLASRRVVATIPVRPHPGCAVSVEGDYERIAGDDPGGYIRAWPDDNTRGRNEMLAYYLRAGLPAPRADVVLGVELPSGETLVFTSDMKRLVPFEGIAAAPRVARDIPLGRSGGGWAAVPVPPEAPAGAYRFRAALVEGNALVQLVEGTAFTVR